MSKARLENLASRLETANGEPRIAGTDVTVRDVFTWSVLDGESAGDIVYRHPELTQDDVEAAILCGWVNRELFQRELQRAGTDVSRFLIRPSDRSAQWVGLVWIVLVLFMTCAATWAKIEFVNAGNAPNVNFLEWIIERSGILLAVVAFGFWSCTMYLMRCYVPWSTKLPRNRFPLIGACAVGTVLILGFSALDLLFLWQTGQPLWNRQAWETRGFMGAVLFLFGTIAGGPIIQIGTCQRAFALSLRGDQQSAVATSVR